MNQQKISDRRKSGTNYSINSHSSTNSMKSMTSSFEILFSKVLDIFIFASAVAITVYNYLTGTLPSQSVHIVEPPPPTLQKKMVTYKLEEEMLKKRRVHEWAEGQKTTTEKSERRHSSACLPDRKIVQPSCSMKRTQSLSCTMEEETLLKMEETLQSLILQCQETLQSPVE